MAKNSEINTSKKYDVFCTEELQSATGTKRCRTDNNLVIARVCMVVTVDRVYELATNADLPEEDLRVRILSALDGWLDRDTVDIV